MNRSLFTHMLGQMVGLTVGLTLGAPAAAAGACDALQVSDGRVQLAAPLGAGGQLLPDEMACLDTIGAALAARGGLRSVTVAARVRDAWRADGTGQRLAAIAGARIGSAGVPTARITMIVPPLGAGAGEGLTITFSESRDTRPVGRVLGATGAVTVGSSADQMVTAAAGAALEMGARVATGPSGSATLGLADGSRLRLEASSLLVLGRLTIDADMQRNVGIEVLAGEVTADVREAGGRFEVQTTAGVAGVRGTTFRVAKGADGRTRLETLDGQVNLGNEQGDVDVDLGMGSAIEAAQVPSPPQALPAMPEPSRPLDASRAARVLAWQAPDRAPAWRLELARDAEFTRDVSVVRGAGARRHRPDLAAGVWYWRVASVDAGGFTGLWSPVHALRVAD